MLLALTRPSRSADLAKLSIKGYRNTPEGAIFTPAALAKQSRPGREISEFFFPKFKGNECLCPGRSLNLYVERTRVILSSSSYPLSSLIMYGTPNATKIIVFSVLVIDVAIVYVINLAILSVIVHVIDLAILSVIDLCRRPRL